MATRDLPLLPSIPDRLRLAARQGVVLPFIGAGVSQLCGCPGWDAFADAALRFFLQSGHLDYGRVEQLSRLPARTKLSIAVGLEQQHKVKIDFEGILRVNDGAKRKIGDRVYGHLAQLARTFVTTNYDDWLDSVATPVPAVAGGEAEAPKLPPSTKRNVYCRTDQLTDLALSGVENVLHIHGHAGDRDSMLLTTSDYLERYASNRVLGSKLVENPYLAFLGHMFATRSVLFVGYGLAELEILEYVIQKGVGVSRASTVSAAPREEPRHHIVQGFFSHELFIMQSLRDYYLREFNVELIAFSKDENGWNQLIEVVAHLAREIPVGGVLASQQRRDMEALLE